MPGDRYASKIALLAHFDAPAVSGISYDVYYSDVQTLWYGNSTSDEKNGRVWTMNNATLQNVDGSGNGQCYYFNNNSSYAQSNVATNLALGTYDFTVELRVYPFNLSYAHLIDCRPSNTEGKYFALAIYDGIVSWHADTGVWHTSSGGGPLYKSMAWNHIAVSRVSGVLRIFINGIKAYEAADTTNYLLPGASRPILSAFGPNPAANLGLFGYMEDLRITRYVGRYTTNFTPYPKELPKTADAFDLEMMDSMTECHQPGTRMKWTYVGAPVLSATNYKFGGRSLYLATNSDYMQQLCTFPFNFAANDFTIECWVRLDTLDTTNGNALFFSSGVAPYRGLELGVNAAGKLSLSLSTNGTNLTTFVSTNSVAAATWVHVAAVRAANMIYLFLDGALDNTPAAFSGAVLFSSTSANVLLGRNPTNTSGGLKGHMDELRVTNGVGRYTASFTTEVAPFTLDQTSVSGTVEDDNGDPVAYPVFAYSEYDGRLIGGTTSSAVDGSFSIPASERCYCVCVHPTKNAQVFAHIDPV
ncbi:MAG: hypothetical protein E6Q97_04720 [Desulfurellales bacterium]|nr:MAG: hypothetical protein E6Q97_04720 [Desulfurellales bacterium]